MNTNTSKLLLNNNNKKELTLLEVKVELERREEIILRLIQNKEIKMKIAAVAVKMKSIRKSISSFIIIIIILVGMKHFKLMLQRLRQAVRKNDH